ncbi:GNAT family N-acetyltransferase [Paenibacillus sp. J5C_2022]|uniref:GNAT family N-acetyltransferase n=1 Tax=Paenibacillus sp. J5C2022 TaxID=2977129 RepID=UPI0021D188C5|nr:GNAT family N-acetyltransferase [Paenibacillus sp. J5C2022]MCU6710645.1 GNAT family N-acetyltransferase [Paenibacillus sp. J5C2022]
MSTHYIQLADPGPELAEVFSRWETDPALVPLTRPNRSKTELEQLRIVTQEELAERLQAHHIYLIYSDNVLVGEMNYMIDPGHLYKKEEGTAWIGITIGEPEGRGKGIGGEALRYLEQQIKAEGLRRIELGVFEFNSQARKLYRKLGYEEIGHIPDFTYWQDRMWSDIRMEKYL